MCNGCLAGGVIEDHTCSWKAIAVESTALYPFRTPLLFCTFDYFSQLCPKYFHVYVKPCHKLPTMNIPLDAIHTSESFLSTVLTLKCHIRPATSDGVSVLLFCA